MCLPFEKFVNMWADNLTICLISQTLLIIAVENPQTNKRLLIVLHLQYFYEFDEAPVDITMHSVSKARILQMNERKSMAFTLLTFAFISNILLSMLVFVGFLNFSVFMRIYRHWIALKFKQNSGLVSKHAGLFSGDERLPMILEILFLMLIPYPWLVGNICKLYCELFKYKSKT